MNLANWLTTMRIILTLFCVFFVIFPMPYHKLIALGIFILAALTDGLDGYAARVRKEITAFGKSFDPLADKILIITVLISLASKLIVPWWAVIVICAREIAVTFLRVIVAKQGIAVGASSYGKIKTFTQILAVGAYIIQIRIAPYLLGIAIFFTIFSGIDYVILWRIGRKSVSIPEKELTKAICD